MDDKKKFKRGPKADKAEKAKEAPAKIDIPAASMGKAEAIAKSKMPEYQKKECLAALEAPKEQSGIPFKVYAAIKKIPSRLHSAMLIWPDANGVKMASKEQWDKIFKKF